MPSDDRVERALEAVAEDHEAFRSAVAGAVDEVGGLLEEERVPAGGERRRDSSLGQLAEGRIDPERFASVLEESDGLDPGAVELVERAHEVLEEVHRSGRGPVRLELGVDDDLRDEAAAALARAGRAFGAARTVELARSGRFREDVHAGYLDAFPPAMWNAEERRVAPPLVIRLPGEALRPGGLAEMLDGSLKIVLVVEGRPPAAPLVRLVTPGALIVQTDDPEDLAPVLEHDGPGVAALFPAGTSSAARFCHRPAADAALSTRLSVEHLPDADDLRPVGAATRSQQAEELGQLRALALAADAAAVSENGGPPAAGDDGEGDPADRLAGWLLRQSGLEDLEG